MTTPREALIELWAANEGEADTLNEIVDAIEADARAAERKRLAAAVRGLDTGSVYFYRQDDQPLYSLVGTEHILAILEGKP